MVADHLSENYLNETTEKLVDEFSVNALSYLPITPGKYAELQNTASADLETILLWKYILEGWPEDVINFLQKYVPTGITEMNLLVWMV